MTPRTAAHQASLSLTISQNLPQLSPLNWWCHPTISSSVTLFSCLQTFPASVCFPTSWVFSNESALCIRWLKDWSFSISPSKEYSGLISFKTDYFDLFSVQGTLKNLLQHHSSKASILWHFAISSSSHNHTWLRERPLPWLYGSLSAKWHLCLLTQSRFVTAFLPISNCLLTSGLQSLPSTVI